MALLKSLASLKAPDLASTAHAWLASYNPDGTFTTAKAFQYYPETITDNRSVNLEEKFGIGSSHPIYQWTRGSAREIRFDAVFTSENESKTGTDSISSTVDKIRGWVKNPATALAGALGAANAPDLKHTQDISAAVNWLRSFTYPTYQAGGKVLAPPKLLLWLEGSGITSNVQGVADIDVLPVVMTTCDVVYEAFFNNGAPRIATVSLQFLEIIQVGTSWKYVGRTQFESLGSKYTGPVSSREITGSKNAKVPGAWQFLGKKF